MLEPLLHAWDSVQITEDSNKRFQFIKPIWATFHFNGTIYFWEGIIRGWLKPWQCVNLTAFISFKGRQPFFAQACFSGRGQEDSGASRGLDPCPLPVAERQNYLKYEMLRFSPQRRWQRCLQSNSKHKWNWEGEDGSVLLFDGMMHDDMNHALLGFH